MRLLVDLQVLQGPSAERGIGYYARSLVRALADSRRDHELLVLLDGARSAEGVLEIRHALAGTLGRNDVVLFEAPAVDRRRAGRPDAELVREAAVAALAPDVVLLSSVFELPALAPVTVNEHCSDVPTAAVLYDLIPLGDLDRHKADPLSRQEYLRALEQLARTDLLLSISDHSAAEARRLVERCPPVTTIHGAAPPPQPVSRPSWAPAGGFALAVGRDEPRKDVATAVLAWAGLSPQVRQGRPFVIVGEWPHENKLRLLERAQAAGLPAEDVVFAGQAGDREVAWAYERADVLLFPSLEEGLGLPPLEAMQVGTPVLMAAATSLVELLDDPRAYAPPADVPALTDCLTQLLTDDAVRAELVAAGHRAARRFTWERTAALTWSALEGLVKPTVHAPVGVRVARVGGAVALPESYVVTDVEPGHWDEPWSRFDRVLHVLPAGDSHTDADELADRPGVVVVRAAPPISCDVGTLLAPAVGVLVPDADTCTALLRRGVSSVPVHVVDLEDAAAVAEAVELAYASDVGRHWAAGAAGLSSTVDGAPVEQRPRWAARGLRGPLLASDVTVYRTTPFLSGIQRTAARLHHALTDLLREDGGAVVPFSLGTTTEGTAHPDIRADEVLAAAEVRTTDPDWLLCIDLNSQLATGGEQLRAARARGVGLAVNVFDLIPYTNPEWFPPGAAASSFTPWLQQAITHADVLLVNSRATAQALATYVRAAPPGRPDAFAVSWLPLGCDFDQAADVVVGDREPAHFLMVGTVEPRKGHRAVLDAFDRLWAAGVPVQLTVLGRSGWMVESIVRRMEACEATQPRFTWLQNASDAELDRLYRTCTAAIVASEGEGFGLPVVEAALRGCPVLVHDIPVLREVAGDDATFFSAADPLADVLQRVLTGAPVAQASRDGLRTWRDVGARLMRILGDEEEPLAQWTPEDGWSWQ
ncbi:MAG: hypothetical protein JWN08_2826 [Frankiales bacterium]|nr:hypothetical protein [Frankiales bacterium]